LKIEDVTENASNKKGMDFKQIQELVKLVSKSGIGELKIKDGEFQITIRAGGYTVEPMPQQAGTGASNLPAPVAPSLPLKAEAPRAETRPSAESNGHHVIKSPMVGTFYRRPGPDKEVFVKPGDKIHAGDVICIIEAMKLFNEIESDVGGTVVKILVEDSTPVEYDQPLLLLDVNG
jgi:acetyl-CoA carboxylase biotin carboxyl carrier protein